MNDSFGQISSPARPAVGRGFGGGGQTVQILKLPADISNIAKAIRLEGQITSLRPNNTATLQTQAGDIDIQIKGNRQPQVGQRVELEIPPNNKARHQTGNPQTNNQSSSDQTRQAVIRSAPTPPAVPDSARITPKYSGPLQANVTTQSVVPKPLATTTAPNGTPIPAPTQGQPSPQQPSQTALPNNGQILTKTTLPPTVQEGIIQGNNTAPAPPTGRPLVPDALVRLLPTPPAQAQNIATQFFQSLPPPVQNIVTQTAFTANIAVQNTQSGLIQNLLQNVSPPPTSTTTQNILTSPIQITPQPIQNALTSLIQNIALSLPASTNTSQSITLPVIVQTPALAPTIPATQTLPIQAFENFLQSTPTPPTASTTPAQNLPQTVTLTPAPITTTAIGNTAAPVIQPSAQPIGPIDVQIIQVTPPQPTLTAPNANTPILNTPILNAPTVNTVTPQVIPATTAFTPPITSANNAVTVTAQVTGFTAQNLPLVTIQWPGARIPQSFVLQNNASNLLLGSQIQVVPKTAPTTINAAATATATTARAPLINPLLQGFQWPALNDLYTSLQQLSPQAAASLSRALPNAGTPTQIAPAAMIFIAAIRSGDLGSWLGDKKMDLLQQAGKSDILSRLNQNSGTTARAPAAEAAPTSDWRAVPLPMFWEGAIHKITLYTRNENQSGQQEENKNGSTRFVFDLSLSRMGDIQLDGLLRDDRLDLVVRAHNTFSHPMQQTMRQAYSGALDQTNLTGELNFQGDTKNWVHVLEQKEALGVNV